MEYRYSVRSMTLAVVLSAALCGCAGSLPVPGGDEQVNSKGYDSQQDLLNRINGLQIGMTESLVMTMLKKTESDLIRLNRPEIMTALYGGGNSGFNGTYEEQERARAFLQTLSGFRLNYVSTEKEHGFSSLIRMKTHETGYSYVVTLVFQNGRLFDKPIVSGGVVDGTTSKTVFDYLNPGNIFSRF